MPFVQFGNYDYVPVLAAAEVERIAYAHIQPDTRAGILPVFELTRARGGRDLEESAAMLEETMTLPFLLDLDKRYAPPPYQAQNPSNPVAERLRVDRETQENDAYNAYLSELLSPAGGFENWRNLSSRFGSCVPVIQYTNPAAQANAIIRQASLLTQNGSCVAFRIPQAQSEVLIPIVIQVFALLPSSAQCLVVFDCGQGRRGIQEKIEWVTGSMSLLQAGLEPDQIMGLSAVCMSNSYPNMNHDGIRLVENCDRRIWLGAFEQFPFHFGDYAASPRSPSLSAFTPRSFRATVVHSKDDQWLVHRHENADDPQGWIDGARIIVAHEQFEPAPWWTDGAISAAARGDLSGMETPRPWHAARIAGHIDRQFRYEPPFEDFYNLLG